MKFLVQLAIGSMIASLSKCVLEEYGHLRYDDSREQREKQFQQYATQELKRQGYEWQDQEIPEILLKQLEEARKDFGLPIQDIQTQVQNKKWDDQVSKYIYQELQKLGYNIEDQIPEDVMRRIESEAQGLQIQEWDQDLASQFDLYMKQELQRLGFKEGDQIPQEVLEDLEKSRKAFGLGKSKSKSKPKHTGKDGHIAGAVSALKQAEQHIKQNGN